jgi:hypothetical protein
MEGCNGIAAPEGLGGIFLEARSHTDIKVGPEVTLQICDLFEDPDGPRLLLEVLEALK